MSLERKRLALSSLPLVCGVRTLPSTSSKPASRANLSTLGSRLLAPPPPMVTIADMLSVSHRRGTPWRRAIVASRHLSRSSRVLVSVLMNTWSLENPSVALNTLNAYSAPSRPCMTTSSFQSNCSCSPGAVSNLGCASTSRGTPTPMPLVLSQCVSALYPGSGGSASECLSSSHSCMPLAVTPGSCALPSISPR